MTIEPVPVRFGPHHWLPDLSNCRLGRRPALDSNRFLIALQPSVIMSYIFCHNKACDAAAAAADRPAAARVVLRPLVAPAFAHVQRALDGETISTFRDFINLWFLPGLMLLCIHATRGAEHVKPPLLLADW